VTGPASGGSTANGKARPRILVVEDEPQLRALLRLYLERDGYVVTDVGDGAAALAAYDAEGPDLVILDLMLPRMQGETVLEELRDRGTVPVLITSAKRTDADRIAGLRLGADDYLGKPFNPHEVTARVAAILRRATPSPGNGAVSAASLIGEPILSLADGRLTLDPSTRQFSVATERGTATTGRLTPGEARLLLALARRPGLVMTREQLLDAVARRPDDVFERVVDVHVANLRRKLGDDAAHPWLIETVPQAGYRLVAARDLS
jgi:two-component system OmpR family response regulator